MNGKGDSSRIKDSKKFRENWATVFEPKEPFKSDIKKYEGAYRTHKERKELTKTHGELV